MGVSTTARQTRSEQCRKNAQAKSERKRRTAFEALMLLQQEGKPVTKAAVAKRAGVSVVFLRSHPDLVQAIEEAEQGRLHTPTTPSPDRTKNQVIAALRRRLEEMKQAIGKKDAELRQNSLPSRSCWRSAHRPLRAHRSAHDAVRVEVHHTEHSTSNYQGRPLTAMSRDAMLMEQIQ